jgi:hypothetical protein
MTSFETGAFASMVGSEEQLYRSLVSRKMPRVNREIRTCTGVPTSVDLLDRSGLEIRLLNELCDLFVGILAISAFSNSAGKSV